MINEKLNKKMGNRLKECRERKNMTQKALSDLCFCTPQTISYIENGKRNMSRDLAHRFAEILAVEESYLLCESDFMTVAEKHQHAEEVMSIKDSAVWQYLHSLGHNISFSFNENAEITEMLDYLLENNINTRDKLLYTTTYSNNLKLVIANRSAIANDVFVDINGIRVSLIDYLDIVEDLNNYTNYLIAQLPKRKERRLKHLELGALTDDW